MTENNQNLDDDKWCQVDFKDTNLYDDWVCDESTAMDIEDNSEVYEDINEAKGNDFEDKEPTTKQIKGIDKSIGDAKEALALAMKKVKELAPDIKKLAKETNDKIKKNPAGKVDYLKTYTTNPDVKEFIKLRKMLKSADLL